MTTRSCGIQLCHKDHPPFTDPVSSPSTPPPPHPPPKKKTKGLREIWRGKNKKHRPPWLKQTIPNLCGKSAPVQSEPASQPGSYSCLFAFTVRNIEPAPITLSRLMTKGGRYLDELYKPDKMTSPNQEAATAVWSP